ncbi:hypothetical protein ACFQL1_14925 [Halomicroarcula sp. GCM10025709]|uniref:hypothetical protein n=1 Tax=Halomicroarcula sp. GCM10025709 TaxID=3252669 RepID=UPI00360BBCBB
MAEDDRTITRTRTEHRVEEVEEELHLCRNCDQAYQPDEMLTVGVDISKHDRAYAKRKLCAGCADSVLDYAEPQDSRDHLEATLVENRRTVWLAGLPWLAGGVAILTAAVFGDVVGVFEGRRRSSRLGSTRVLRHSPRRRSRLFHTRWACSGSFGRCWSS